MTSLTPKSTEIQRMLNAAPVSFTTQSAEMVAAFADRLADEETEDLLARFGDGVVPDATLVQLVAVIAGFAAAMLLAPDVIEACRSEDGLREGESVPWNAESSVITKPDDADLRALVRAFGTTSVSLGDWTAARELERKKAFTHRVLLVHLERLASLVPDAVFQWLDGDLAAELDGAEAERMKSRDVFVLMSEASSNGVKRVTQNMTVRRSLDQMFSGARKARQQLFARNADDTRCEAWVKTLVAAYSAWLARETPPVGIALLIAVRIAALAAELRGIPLRIMAYNCPVLLPCAQYVADRVPSDDWTVCGRSGMDAWHSDASRYWAEGLAGLVPGLRSELRSYRRAGIPAIRSRGQPQLDAELAIKPGETNTRWQARLRDRVKASEAAASARDAQHAKSLAQAKGDHSVALSALEVERQELRRRVAQAEELAAEMAASLLRVERDAQLAMQRVVQLEDAIDAQGAVAPVLVTLEGVTGEADPEESPDSTDQSGLPADCFRGHRVFVFTGQLRQGIQELIAERFRRLGCDEVQVRLIHRDHGPERFRATDCIVMDLTFASHADTAKVRVKGQAAGAWIYQTKRGLSTLAGVSGRAWLESRYAQE